MVSAALRLARGAAGQPADYLWPQSLDAVRSCDRRVFDLKRTRSAISGAIVSVVVSPRLLATPARPVPEAGQSRTNPRG